MGDTCRGAPCNNWSWDTLCDGWSTFCDGCCTSCGGSGSIKCPIIRHTHKLWKNSY